MLDLIKDKVKSFINPETVRCPGCKAEIKQTGLRRNLMVCPECGRHLRVDARSRIAMVADPHSFEELFSGLESSDFFHFPGYSEKLEKAEKTSGEKEAVVCGTVRIGGVPTAIFAMDPRFIMASMGSVVGEKITRLFETAAENHLPVIGFTASGGARMQEGIVSLMQMAKVSGAVKRHSDGGNLYITVLTDPTTGGVTASFAMQGDILLAEPGALIGFAGRRVVEQTTKSKLPDNFQTAEFLLEHGFIDQIVPRSEMTKTLGALLRLHQTKEAACNDSIRKAQSRTA
ncbi:MAG: acetyl-CoA carboxylase, carboxyltransferase subunit beta [Firmicutes bacterium]|nr:acetyl-CoA carboxylase, carboxyltransferase subunit beta [Bacillota bacterium]